jgi:hypothetical protein
MAELCFPAFISYSLSLVLGVLVSPAMEVAPLDGGTLVAGRGILVLDYGSLTVQASEIGCDRFYHLTTSPDGGTVAVWAGSETTDCVVKVTGSGIQVLGPYAEAGLPCWDAAGNLWFTAEGSLYCNGEPTDVLLDAYHISVSPDGDRVVFTDQNDKILVLELETAIVDTVSSAFRFYAPFFIPDGSIVSSSLDGGIRFFSGGEELLVDFGDQPAWWPLKNSLVYIKTTDDGMYITSSELYMWTEAEGSSSLTDTPHCHETMPYPARNGILFVDVLGGLPGFLEVEEQSFTRPQQLLIPLLLLNFMV